MRIPIAKPYLTEEEAQNAFDTVLSGWVTQGPKVAEFEEKFANYVGSKYAVAVSNCTTALHLAMLVAGVAEGDEVICPSMSYVATANCIRYVGANPIFAEVNEEYNLDIQDVKAKITSKTKAILLVHQIGMPADIDVFRILCNEKGLVLIEDAACATGSSYQSGKIGSHSDLVCFSFHPRKVITTGDGGMVATSNEDYNNRLRLLRQHAMSVNDRVRHESKKVIQEDHLELAYNYRLTDIQAAVGIKQLEKLDWIIEERRKIAKNYLIQLADIPSIRLPKEREGYFSNYQSFSIYIDENCTKERDEIMQILLDKGVATRRGIMTSHRETAYKYLDLKGRLPQTEDLSDRSLLIPLYVGLTEEEQQYVIDQIRAVLCA